MTLRENAPRPPEKEKPRRPFGLLGFSVSLHRVVFGYFFFFLAFFFAAILFTSSRTVSYFLYHTCGGCERIFRTFGKIFSRFRA
jgi:hypothetical protein